MIKTKYGNFDGDKWESICQLCLKKKHNAESYTAIDTGLREYGIKGFTKAGKAFQYYCPDEYYKHDILLEKQITQITKDLKKIQQHEVQLNKKLGGISIAAWYFVTPAFNETEIIAHCNKKRDEIKALKLSIIDNKQFEIIPLALDYLKPELHLFLKNHGTDSLSPLGSPIKKNIKWHDKNIPLVNKILRTHEMRFAQNTKDIKEKTNSLTETSIQHFIDGNTLLEKWRIDYPDDFENFLHLISQLEKKIVKDSTPSEEGQHVVYNKLNSLVEEQIMATFPFLEHTMIQCLSNQVVADWIIRDPINFK